MGVPNIRWVSQSRCPLPITPTMPAQPVVDPAKPAASSPLAACGRFVLGAGVLVGCLLAGEALRRVSGLKVPANMLGLFLLLGLLGIGVVKLSWVESTAGALLGILPMLFLPIFVCAAEDRHFWAERGVIFSAAVLAGLLALWALVGHLAQWLFTRFPSPVGSDDPGPLTEAEAVRAAAEVSDRGETATAPRA